MVLYTLAFDQFPIRIQFLEQWVMSIKIWKQKERRLQVYEMYIVFFILIKITWTDNFKVAITEQSKKKY